MYGIVGYYLGGTFGIGRNLGVVKGDRGFSDKWNARGFSGAFQEGGWSVSEGCLSQAASFSWLSDGELRNS